MNKAPTIEELSKAITDVCIEVRDILHSKNEAYGNSVADPFCVFFHSDAIERIAVRADDKISRIVRGKEAGEDTELDLIGYLMLKRAILKIRKEKEENEQR